MSSRRFDWKRVEDGIWIAIMPGNMELYVRAFRWRASWRLRRYRVRDAAGNFEVLASGSCSTAGEAQHLAEQAWLATLSAHERLAFKRAERAAAISEGGEG